MPDDRYDADVLSRKRNRRAVPEVVAEPGAAPKQPAVSASGSVRVAGHTARTARDYLSPWRARSSILTSDSV